MTKNAVGRFIPDDLKQLGTNLGLCVTQSDYTRAIMKSLAKSKERCAAARNPPGVKRECLPQSDFLKSLSSLQLAANRASTRV